VSSRVETLAVEAVERAYWTSVLRALGVTSVVTLALWYSGFFEVSRYVKGWDGIVQIVVREGMPPDFGRRTGALHSSTPWP
jgi:hypothetical protein